MAEGEAVRLQRVMEERLAARDTEGVPEEGAELGSVLGLAARCEGLSLASGVEGGGFRLPGLGGARKGVAEGPFWLKVVKDGRFVAVFTTLSHVIMGYGGVLGSGLDWLWFCGGIGVNCGMMAKGWGGRSVRQYGIRVVIDTGWVDIDGGVGDLEVGRKVKDGGGRRLIGFYADLMESSPPMEVKGVNPYLPPAI